MKSDGKQPDRLVDGAAKNQTPSGEWAVDLLRAESPYEVPAGRKQRVRLGMGHATARWTPLLLRVGVAGVVLLGCGAIASAALGHWPDWAVRVYERIVPRSAPRTTASLGETGARALRASEGGASVAVAGPEIAPEWPAAEPVVPAIAPPPAPATTRAASTNRAPAVAPRARRSTSMPPSEDASPVLEAMRALRLDRNPVKARALLGRYLERHPNGALAEEALAMSIEAAVAHHDADAAALSARYLRAYPQGPFHNLARHTLDAAATGARR